MKTPFNPGQIVVTRGVAAELEHDLSFSGFVFSSLKRHLHCDWGDLDAEDKKENELSLKEGYRLLSAYNGPKKIWIITEADRSATCILFPSEY